ncbi:MAG: racemase, partial [Arthrobacter sp.]|nr:racemase [Arthrobacter sp.]
MSAPAAVAVRTEPRITGLTTRLITVPLRRSWGVEAPEN